MGTWDSGDAGCMSCWFSAWVYQGELDWWWSFAKLVQSDGPLEELIVKSYTGQEHSSTDSIPWVLSRLFQKAEQMFVFPSDKPQRVLRNNLLA